MTVGVANQMQRRLTTILAADVANYSRLTGADEEGTLTRLRDLRRELLDPPIQSNRGRVFHTAGDSVLIEFTSVVDAARCALEVQRGMPERNAEFALDKHIQFRIGIHLGDVVVQEDGDLLGDGVNIAARLESLAEPGGICLSNAAYEQVRDKIDATFDYLGDKELKNITRPVQVFSVALDPNAKPQKFRNSSTKPAADGSPPRLSIVVLPFTNIGGDFEQEYFVDGISESLTTDLSRISGSFVIGRNTAFTYKGKHSDLKQIGRDLGVRYVLEGSVQRSSERMRVNVQLIDAETGTHLWAERFDKLLADLFDMQDEIVARLANQLCTELLTAEARRAQRAPHPDSMDLYFQGAARLNEGRSPEYLAQARHFFERALALDPGNIEAMVGSAFIDFQFGASFMTDDRATPLAAAEAVLTKVLSLAPSHPFAACLLGGVHIFSHRAVQGIAECERAIGLDRNMAAAHAFIGLAKGFVGRGDETEADVREALRLSPRDSNAALWMIIAGMVKIYIGDDEEAVAWLRRAIETNRNFPIAHFSLGAALAQLGRLAEARPAVKSGLALDPTFTVARFRSGGSSDNPIYLAQRERIYAGMREAGVPEQ